MKEQRSGPAGEDSVWGGLSVGRLRLRTLQELRNEAATESPVFVFVRV